MLLSPASRFTTQLKRLSYLRIVGGLRLIGVVTKYAKKHKLLAPKHMKKASWRITGRK